MDTTITAAEFRASPGVEDWSAQETGADIVFRTGRFAKGAELFAIIAKLADASNHHPDVDIRYGTVRVHLFTHSAGGLTPRDAALARQISDAAHALGIPVDRA